MIRIPLLSFLFFLGSFSISAQTLSQLTKLADQYYDQGKYLEAIEFYKSIYEVSPDDQEIQFNLAMAYFKARKYKQSRNEFTDLISSGYNRVEAHYYFGYLLKVNREYEKADSVFSKLINTLSPPDPYYRPSKLQSDGCRLGLRQFLTNNSWNYKTLDIVNSLNDDFAPVVHPKTGDLYISSTRKSRRKQFTDGQFGGFLPEILSFKSEDTTYLNSESAKPLNTPWSESSGSFSKDGKSFYYTSCKANEHCKIMVSRLSDTNQWLPGQALDSLINMPNSDSEHPWISATGDTLFFVSNRPGGLGGKDIYMSLKESENEWIVPINLGAGINTTEDEISPFYSSSFAALIFSSNGHAGYGGFDLFMGKGVSFFSPEVYNLGPPFNSPFDDIYFVPGFAASNRSGSFNIYHFDYRNEVGLLRSFLNEESLIQVVRLTANSLSLESFRIEDYKGYSLFDPEEIQAKDFSEEVHLHRNVTGLTEPNRVAKLRISDQIEIVTIANELGTYEFRLLPDTITDYHVKVADQEVESFMNGTTYSYYEYDFEKIYFDFNTDNLRRESIETLKDLIGEFDLNNILLVDVHTHADHVGNKDYNFDLSERRGLSILKELNQMGVSYNQMRVFANGEDSPQIQSQSWYGRLFNRRAELVVYTKAPVTYSHPEIFLLRKDVSVEQIAEYLSIESEQLIKWNGIESANLQEGHVLRVFNPNHLTPNLRYLIPESDLEKKIEVYIVKPGDTIASLAEQFNVLEEVIIESNHLTSQQLKVGMEIVLHN